MKLDILAMESWTPEHYFKPKTELKILFKVGSILDFSFDIDINTGTFDSCHYNDIQQKVSHLIACSTIALSYL